jgi:transposase-like protein
MKKRYPRSFWERLVAEVESGETLRAVASRRGVNRNTLTWWKYRVRAAPSEPNLLPVVVRSEPSSVAAVVEGLVKDLVVRVAIGTEPGYVAALAGALREC